MEQIEKLKLLALAAVGKRQEALDRIQKAYSVNSEQAEKLLEAMEAESAGTKLDMKQVWRWAGIGLFLVGVVLVGIGVSAFVAYESNDERQMVMIKCTISDIREHPDGLEATFSYVYHDQAYSNTEHSEVFRQMGFVKGQEMDLLVNADNPTEAFLPSLKPYVQATGLRYGGVGLGLIVISILLWRWMVARSRQ